MPSITLLDLMSITTSLNTHSHTHSHPACAQFCWWHRVVNLSNDRTLAVEQGSSMYHKDDWKWRESGSRLWLWALTGKRSETVCGPSRSHTGQRSDHRMMQHKMLQHHMFVHLPSSSSIMTRGDWRPCYWNIPRLKQVPGLICKHRWKY